MRYIYSETRTSNAEDEAFCSRVRRSEGQPDVDRLRNKTLERRHSTEIAEVPQHLDSTYRTVSLYSLPARFAGQMDPSLGPSEGDDDQIMEDADANSTMTNKIDQRDNPVKTSQHTTTRSDGANEQNANFGTQRDTGGWKHRRNGREGHPYSSWTDKRALLDQLRQKDEKIKSLERQHEEDQDSYRQLQEIVLQTIEPAVWAPPDDSVTREWLVRFARDAKKWSRTEGLALASVEQIGESQAGEIARSGILENVLSVQLSDERIGKVKVHILLEALLQHFVSSQILDDWSFFLYRRLRESGALENDLPMRTVPDAFYTVTALFKDLEKCDPREAHSVRSHILRIMYPPNLTDGGMKQRKLIDDAIRAHCSDLSRSFLQQVSPLLNQSYPSTVETQLQTILESIGKFSYKLWTQKTLFMTRGLRGDEHLPSKFYSDSEDMDHHDVHLNISQDDPTALDGWQVALVVQPAVIRKGDREGFDPKIVTVLKKAVVLLVPSS